MGEPANPSPAPLLPVAAFMTLEVLRRLHNLLAERTIEQRCGWCKQSALAKVVATFTGASVPFDSRKEYAYAGNAMDTAVKLYTQRLRKAQLAAKARAAAALKAALKAGKEPLHPIPCAMVAALQQQLFICRFGTTPRAVVLPRDDGKAGSSGNCSLHRQPVPWEVHADPAKLCTSLINELVELRQQPAAVPALEKALSQATARIGVSERAQHKALAQTAKERCSADEAKADAQRRARDKSDALQKQHGEWKAAKKLQVEETLSLRKRVAVMGGHVARASLEAGVEHHRAALLQEAAAASATALETLAAAAALEQERLRCSRTAALRRARSAECELESHAAMSSASRSAKRCRTQIHDECGPESDGEAGDAGEAGEAGASDGDAVADAHDPAFLPAARAAANVHAAAAAAAAQAAEVRDAALALERVRAMPTWQAVRGLGAGKGRCKIEWGTRCTIYSLLSAMVPLSAIGTAIVIIVKRTAPWLRPTAPTVTTLGRCRFELRLVVEACSARMVAGAHRVAGIGFDETTKKGHGALTSNVSIQLEPGGPLIDVVLRAAYTPLGGTSALVVQSIDRKCFGRLRDLLRRWKAKFESMFPGEVWTGPDAERLGLHQLGDGSALMSDTCNPARCAKRLLGERIAAEVEKHIGVAQWASMTDAEKEQATRTHPNDCWQHLRNIFLAEMSKAQSDYMKKEMEPELAVFTSWERVTTDFSQLLRASYKEFHHGCNYYKGKGMQYGLWLRQNHGAAFVVHLERAEGGRQDLDYDAAVPMYIDRKYFVEYLHGVIFGPKHSNILEDYLYVTYSSLQYVAAIRANAIVDLLVSRPMRWLSGKGRELHDWSPYSMGMVLDIVEQFFEKAQHDGSLFLDPNLDLFKSIADKQPLFEEHRKFTYTEDFRRSPDGSTSHLIFKLVRDELLNPVDPTNLRTRDKTIEYLEVQCVAALRKMHDPKLALSDKLTSLDGANSFGNQAQGHTDTVGCHANNDQLAESVFGIFDMIMKRCPGVSQAAASAVAQAIRMKIVSPGDHVAHRKVLPSPSSPSSL